MADFLKHYHSKLVKYVFLIDRSERWKIFTAILINDARFTKEPCRLARKEGTVGGQADQILRLILAF